MNGRVRLVGGSWYFQPEPFAGFTRARPGLGLEWKLGLDIVQCDDHEYTIDTLDFRI